MHAKQQDAENHYASCPGNGKRRSQQTAAEGLRQEGVCEAQGNGGAEQHHGHRYARFRGLFKVQMQCLLAATAQNMKEMALFYGFFRVLKAALRLATMRYGVVSRRRSALNTDPTQCLSRQMDSDQVPPQQAVSLVVMKSLR
jgi:hypothetical protein